MKRISTICIVGGSDAFTTELYNHVKHDIPKEWAKKYKYSVGGPLYLPLEENSPSYQYVMDMARNQDLHPRVFQMAHYTKSEIERTEYFRMFVYGPLELEGTSAFDYGTQYEGGCSHCGQGGKRVGDVLVDRKFVRKHKIGTLYPDIYVTNEIRRIIESGELTGVSFEHEVRDFKGREIPKLYVMEISNLLPPMSESTWLKLEYEFPQYKACGHEVIYLMSDIQYEKEKLDTAQDFNLTSEYVNNNREREIIVSSKVRKLFMQHKIHVGFTPVALL